MEKNELTKQLYSLEEIRSKEEEFLDELFGHGTRILSCAPRSKEGEEKLNNFLTDLHRFMEKYKTEVENLNGKESHLAYAENIFKDCLGFSDFWSEKIKAMEADETTHSYTPLMKNTLEKIKTHGQEASDFIPAIINSCYSQDGGEKKKSWLRRNWKKLGGGLLIGGAIFAGALGYLTQASHKEELPTRSEYNPVIIFSINTTRSVERAENIAYSVLTQYENVPEEDIILLMDWREDATFNNFKKAIKKVAERVDENSVTTITIFGHGTGTGVILGPGTGVGEFVTFEEFDREIDKITKGIVVVIVDACFPSTTPLHYGPTKRIVIQQGGPNEVARGYHSSMLGNMFLALTGPDKKYTFPPYAVNIYRLNADLDNDGFVSVYEAYKFAENQILSYDIMYNVRAGERRNPQIWDPHNIAKTTYITKIPVTYQDENNVGPLYHK